MPNHSYYLELAEKVASASKCPKAKYGAVIVDANNRIVSTGYNGKPAGSANDSQCLRPTTLPIEQRHYCCLHAECNAIMYCDRHSLKGATIYVNGIPCEACALLIMQSGISRVVFYDEDNAWTGHNSGASPAFWQQFDCPVELCPIQR